MLYLEMDEFGLYEADFNEAGADRACQRYREGVKRATLYLEDTIVVLPLCSYTPREVVSFCAVSGVHHRNMLSDAQVCAMLMLAIGGEEVTNAAIFYEELSPLTSSWPSQCRPIP